MQTLLKCLLVLFPLSVSTLFAQDSTQSQQALIKKGWNFGLLPAVSYNTDLGFQYGGLVNLFHYGDGSRYPNYDHSFYLEASRYTKGSGLLRFAYDSDQLIDNIRLSFDLSYMPEQAIDFFGFNGYEAVYNADWADDSKMAYRSRMFYKHKRNMLRLHTDFSSPLFNSPLQWAGGFEYYDINVGSVDIDRLNKGKDENDQLPSLEDVPGLYERYQQWDIIAADEAAGGRFFALKGGLIYDTRDFEPNPTEGIWTELLLYVAPKGLSDLPEGFTRLSITHRQYFTLIANKLVFAGRLSWQSSIDGHVPFYVQPLMITTRLRGAYSEGLGGQRSLRGIMRNRVVGDAIAYANIELRWKIIQRKLFNQNFYLAVNGFTDVGQVTGKIDVADAFNQLNGELLFYDKANYYNEGAEKPHWSVGLGLKLAMNENFILSADYGLALNKQDGHSGLYIGLNYLF
ncbi:MAG: BamA/TamA family outer membrane protein [Bacteroidetes bacterium]|nr:BamA/TamA family outer membrane protein [Bacteroidota bacterium]MBU1577799.1 BamA/TamA family outer membrane protein [Bacteroidota bacterium]MBU2466785.1 BamA/TamA family outer membrane protein [Bacteroidota bacterium]MBU2558759.1 BamA/TamA family outer membrane protein [Bacteroidota bacterium]